MKNKLTIITLLFLITFTLSTGFVTADQPGIPNAYYGTVTIADGETAPDGLEILGQVQQQSYSTQVEDGEYSLIIENPNQDNAGNTVTFFIEGQQIASSTYSDENTVRNLDLDAPFVETVEEGDDDTASSGSGSGSSGSSGGAGGSGGGSIASTNDEDTSQEANDESTGSSTTSETEESTQEETQEETTTNTDSDQTQEETSTEVEEEQQNSAGFLAPITGFVTGLGNGAASLTGFFFLLIILIGLVGGYLFYKNRG